MPRTIRNLASLLVLGLFVAITSGCASKMALAPDTASLDLSEKSIALFTMRVSNDHFPEFQPLATAVFVESAEGDSEQFQPAPPHVAEEDRFNEYLVSVAVAPGSHTLQRVFGVATGFLISATWDMPVASDFSVGAGEVVYIGRIDAAIVERTDDTMPRAGSVIPLVDQSAAGISSGTWDLRLANRHEADLDRFMRAFPVLNGRDIRIAPMAGAE